MAGFFGDMFGVGMGAAMGGAMGGAGGGGGNPFFPGGVPLGAPNMMKNHHFGQPPAAAPRPFGGAIGNRGPFGPPVPNFGAFSNFGGSGAMPFGGVGFGGGGRSGGGGGGFLMPPMPPMMGGPPPFNPMMGQMAANLFTQFESERQRANQANESRYQQLFSMGQQQHQKSMADVANMTNQRRADLHREFNEAGAAGQQSLIDRGLGNTTVTENVRQGNERERSEALNRLADQEIERKIGTRLATVAPWMGVIERRTDQGPDMGMMAQLAMQAGQHGIPVSFGGFGGSAPAFGTARGGHLAYNDPSGGNPYLARRLGLGR